MRDPADARARSRSEAEAAALVDDLARRLAEGGVWLIEAVGQFVAARRPFLTELAAIGRRRTLDPAHLGTLVRGCLGGPRPAAAPVHCRAPGGDSVSTDAFLTVATAVLALVFSLALFDQWRERRGAFQLAGRSACCSSGSRPAPRPSACQRLERGAVPHVVPDRRGLDGRLARARHGVPARPDAVRLRLRAVPLPGGLFTFLVRNRPEYAGAGPLPLLYLIAAAILRSAIAVETYFQNDRWPRSPPVPSSASTLLSCAVMAIASCLRRLRADPVTGVPSAASSRATPRS
jgi:hypothetical protein